jgi:nitroimidazol reductase NimA-like FMN-containing flavoprotein (pyridoxamine 5'-phosphate oxidase superfamily)
VEGIPDQNQGMLKHLFVGIVAVTSFVSVAQAADAGKVLWDYWYTVSVKKIPYEYYNEKAVFRDGKIQFFNTVWKKEEGFINEEQLGSFSNADVDLTPLFYNYRETYRSTEVKIDGNIRDGKTLVVKVTKSGGSLPTVTASIRPKTILSLFFPLWLGKKLETMKENVTVSFVTLQEDNVDDGFNSVSGSARLEKPDDYANKTKTKRVAVDYKENARSYWWVDKQGAALKIEMSDRGTLVERSTKEKAQTFLK